MASKSPARPTIYDVAQEAGVSKSLVSLVLNGSDLVSETKRLAVQEAIERLGYRRSRTASNLARHRSHTIGLVVDNFENPWFAPMLHGLREALAPHGLHVAIREQHISPNHPTAIDEFLESGVDALVVAAEPGHDFADPGVPTVVESTRLHGITGADLVGSDQLTGANLAVEHLANLGHQHIGHISGEGGAAATRRAGFEQAMWARGLEPLVAGRDQDTTEEGGYLGTVELLRRHPQITAVFAANDMMALGARAALREDGRSTPRDCALMGYDNSPVARSRLLDLTTIEPCTHEVGLRAAEALLRRMTEPSAPTLNVQITPRLVVRSSSLPA
ncbi:LacI family DNA-binding transcriptional regulator [Luteococcus sp. Sow4_B9]|uniref:LacI family DNA-binding transcriptional regulator n=1 Tax=Luteococcus sp. Sow4_B9 TaxID=3438792 RepID=UPI003F9D58E5